MKLSRPRSRPSRNLRKHNAPPLGQSDIFDLRVSHFRRHTHAYERCSPSPPPAPRSSVHPCARAPRPPRVALPPSHSPSPGTRPDPSNTYPRRMAVVSFVIPRHPPRAQCADPRRPSIPSTQVIHGGPLPRREGRRRRCAQPPGPKSNPSPPTYTAATSWIAFRAIHITIQSPPLTRSRPRHSTRHPNHPLHQTNHPTT